METPVLSHQDYYNNNREPHQSASGATIPSSLFSGPMFPLDLKPNSPHEHSTKTDISIESVEEEEDFFSADEMDTTRSSSDDNSVDVREGSEVEESPKKRTRKEKGPEKRSDESGEDGKRNGRRKDSIRRKKEKMIAPLSVRSIPCFYGNCTYSYKRPGSNIVEISDRPLLLPKKFDPFVIRSCKKHHDKWKASEFENGCEVCKDLNRKSEDLFYYSNPSDQNFRLCEFCFIHQKDMLKISEETKRSELTPEEKQKAAATEATFSDSNSMLMEGSSDTVSDLIGSLPDGSRTERRRSSQGMGIFLYRRTIADWDPEIPYTDELIWEVPKLPRSGRQVWQSETGSPHPLTLRSGVREFPTLYTETSVVSGVCLGQFGGRVVPAGELTESVPYVRKFTDELMIDARTTGNEMRYLVNGKRTSFNAPNVRLQNSGNEALLVFSTRAIQKNEELVVESNQEQRREELYYEIFQEISQFNQDTLSAEEAKNTAFGWLLEEGYSILKSKGKITIPIECRHPAKKAFASQHSKKATTEFVKREEDWGYVAQLEKLDLLRAREDCWVTFKAGPGWDGNAFLEATKMWAQRTSTPDSPPSAPPSTPTRRKKSPTAKKRKAEKNLLKESKSKEENLSTEDLSQMQINSIPSSSSPRSLEVLEYEELTIAPNGALLGVNRSVAYVFKGYWKGYPVAVRFPLDSEEGKKKFATACSIASLLHPNLVISYGNCTGEKPCLVMEYMSLGNLKDWLVKTAPQIHAMYIPRIAMDMARGLEFIHSKELVHRGLTSTNVLMKGEALDQGLIASLEVKIGDLGKMIETQSISASPFVAPEVQKYSHCSKKSDVYAFGMILCHLFSEGRETPKSPTEVIQSSHYLQTWDNRWKELILACTDSDPQKRPEFSTLMQLLTSLSSAEA